MASASASGFKRTSADGLNTYAWEETSDESEDSSSDGGSDGELSPGDMFADALKMLYMKSGVSARHICILCHWGSLAGLSGPAVQWALPPGKQIGKYNTHLRKCLGVDDIDGDRYVMQVPGHSKFDGVRTEHNVQVLVPHEQFFDEVQKQPLLLQPYKDVANEAWGKTYLKHPVYLEKTPTETVIPIAMYADGVKYSNSDSVLGIWFYSLITQLRHFCIGLRKSLLCKCGCQGWCSMFTVMKFVQWTLECMAKGTWPESRHLGESWGEFDQTRAAFAGKALGFKCALVQIKADWSEFCTTFGFTMWGSLRPCMFCCAGPDNMYSFAECNFGRLPWASNVFSDYLLACDSAEVNVVIATPEQLNELRSALWYDKRSSGSHGRSVKRDVPSLGLVAGDRLEPSTNLPDVSKMETLPLPLHLIFWRPSQTVLTKHRNPIFQSHLGTTFDVICIDSLHCVYLGIMNAFCKELVWAMINGNAWRVTATTEDVKLQLTALRIFGELRTFYARKAKQGHPLSEIPKFTHKHLGTQTKKKLRTKGAETGGFLLYLDEALKISPHFDQKDRWAAAATALIDYVNLGRRSPPTLTVAIQKVLGTIGINEGINNSRSPRTSMKHPNRKTSKAKKTQSGPMAN